MPAKGSNKSHRTEMHTRSWLDDQIGKKDAEVRAEADRRMDDVAYETWPAAQSDRAAGPPGDQPTVGSAGDVIDLRTSAFSPNDLMPQTYAKVGDNKVPPLEWGRVPQETRELALLCVDPDAPRGPFTHWLVTGIDPKTTSLGDGGPEGATVWPNDFGDRDYDGPQPPVGDEPHRYVFRLYALDHTLDVPPGTDPHEVRDVLEADHVAVGTLVGRFGR